MDIAWTKNEKEFIGALRCQRDIVPDCLWLTEVQEFSDNLYTSGIALISSLSYFSQKKKIVYMQV